MLIRYEQENLLNYYFLKCLGIYMNKGQKKYQQAIIKQFLKKIPLVKDLQEIKEELDRQSFDEKLKNQLNLMLELMVQSMNTSEQMLYLIDERKEFLQKEIVLSNQKDDINDELVSLIKLRNLISKKFDMDLGRKISFSKLKYLESEHYAQHINQQDIIELLHYFPSSFVIPVFAANIADILIEAQGYQQLTTGIEYEVINSLKKAEKVIIKQDLNSQVKGYEVLGAFGLLCDDVEFFEKYLQIYKKYDSSFSSKILQNTSWWSLHYYENDIDILKEEYMKAFLNPSYNLVSLHSAFVLATFEFKNVQEVLDLFEIENNNPIYDKLSRIKFK